MFKKIWEMLNSRAVPTRSTTLHSSDVTDTAAHDSQSFHCPSCGGPLKIEFIGQDKSDKIASCPYCQGTVDLPDAADAANPLNSRIRAQERVIERPNEKIVERSIERVSEWTERTSTGLDWPEAWKSDLGEMPTYLLRSKGNDLFLGPLDSQADTDDTNPIHQWEINGQRFSSSEEMHAYVRQHFPTDIADRMLDLMDRASGE